MDRFDAWAKRRARRSQQQADAGLSRRDLLRRGAVIGGVVITTPLIQSVTSPAFAVSGVSPCSDPAQMCGGATCEVQQCQNGGICNTDADCVSGHCIQTGASTVCGDPVVTCTGGDNATKDDSCSTGYCDRTTTNCVTPLPSGITGSVCHGSTQTVANSNCVSGTCTNYNATTNEGTCA